MDTSKQNYTIKKTRTMSFKELLFFTIVVGFGIGAIITYFVWWFDYTHIVVNSTSLLSVNLLLFILLSFVIWHGLSQRLAIWFICFFMKKPVYVEPEKGLKVAMLTCFVPGKEPYDLLEKTLKAMTEVEYPHDTWVLDEGDDYVVKEMCSRLEVNHFSRKGIPFYNQPEGEFKAKTKAGNHNAWRHSFEQNYDFVAQMDMDHVPFPNYLDRILGYFRDQKVAFVVAPQIYTNTENWVAKGAAEQSYIFHGPLQQGFFGQDMPLFIGTNHAYRPKALVDVGGYASTIVEDHLTGMYLYSKGWKGVYVPEVIAEGEGPTNWVEYLNQQMRWSYGIFEVLFKYTPKLLPKLSWNKRISYLGAQTYYLAGVASFLSIILTAIYLIFGYSSAQMEIFGWVKHAFPPFAISIFLQFWIQRFYLDPKTESGIGWRGMLLSLGAMPIYAIAFWKILMRKKLQYAVTVKGSLVDQNNVPLTVFKPHLILIALTIFAVIVSYLNGNDAVQLRFWAFVTIAIFSATVISSQRVGLELEMLLIPRRLSVTKVSLALATFMIIAISTPVFSGVDAPTQFPSGIVQKVSAAPKKLGTEANKIYLGLGGGDIWNRLDQIETATDKDFLIVSKYQSWGDADSGFNKEWASELKDKGSIPMITWEPWSTASGGAKVQPDYQLQDIVNGNYDSYIVKYAKEIKDWNNPVLIRFAHEMNGNWYPWGGEINGNKPEDYKAAWIHVYTIFADIGVKNVTWVWSPNEPFSDQGFTYTSNFDAYYPGDQYVDWVAFSGFNWGKVNAYQTWRSFSDIVEPAYTKLEAYNKPIMISEINTSTYGGDKIAWMNNMNFEILKYPKIKAVVWFETQNRNLFKIDYNAESYTSF